MCWWQSGTDAQKTKKKFDFDIWRRQQEIVQVRRVHSNRKMPFKRGGGGGGGGLDRACRRQDMTQNFLPTSLFFLQHINNQHLPLSSKALESCCLSQLTSFHLRGIFFLYFYNILLCLKPRPRAGLLTVNFDLTSFGCILTWAHSAFQTFHQGAGRKSSWKCPEQLTETFVFSSTTALENVWKQLKRETWFISM